MDTLADMSYQETAYEVMSRFFTDFTEDELKDCIKKAYDSKFDTPEIAPLVDADGEHRRERAAAPGPAVFLSERNFDMKPQTFTWKKLTADELTRVYLDEMRRDFPPTYME